MPAEGRRAHRPGVPKQRPHQLHVRLVRLPAGRSGPCGRGSPADTEGRRLTADWLPARLHGDTRRSNF